MSELSVVVLAAGLGSRFGGDKQLAGIGPNGEAFLDYNIQGCLEAGVENVVMVVRSDIRGALEDHVAAQHENASGFVFVNQDEFGPSRAKPWGTAHAILAAREAVPGAFMVVNADDYYAAETFHMLREILDIGFEHQGGLLGFPLANTLPPEGAVTRGVCRVSDGYLVGIDETKGVHATAEGIFDGDGTELSPDTLVSLNLWGFPGAFMETLQQHWDAFYAEHADDPDAECLLPDAVGAALATGEFEFRVRPCESRWVGVTYADDLAAAREAFSAGRPD